jgi:phenylacetate-CoA ligase
MNWRKPTIQLLLRQSGSRLIERLNEIERLEKCSPAELAVYQSDKLKTVLLHATRTVPYYKKILPACGVAKNDAVDLSAFSNIPILTKEILKEKYNELKSDDAASRKAFRNTSGGSTGSPVAFMQDPHYYDWNVANKIYYKSFVGHEVGEPELRLWGAERDILGYKEKPSVRLKNWIFNRKELNSFRMNENTMVTYVKEWNAHKPHWVEAYAQSIYEFGQFIKRHSLDIFSPKGIVTTAGTLYPYMKDTIEEVFRCKTFNRYGSREVGDIACNCAEQKGLHLSMWNQFIEILDEELRPVSHPACGKIYITTLNNFSMPLIRYDIGDLAVPHTDPVCSCGRGTTLIAKVEGREMCMLKTRDGKLIPGEFFIHFIGVVFNKGFIKKFQIIQKAYDLVVIKVMLSDESAFSEERPRIEKSIREVMNEECRIVWETVDDIPTPASGKYMYTICEIPE